MNTYPSLAAILPLLALSACSLSTSDYTFDADQAGGAAGASAGTSGSAAGHAGAQAGEGGASGQGGEGGTSGQGGGGGDAGQGGEGGTSGGPGGKGGAAGKGGGGPCSDGEKRCQGADIEACAGGVFTKESTCPKDSTCGMVGGQPMCVSCAPGTAKCAGNTLLRCTDEGTGFAFVETCSGEKAICDDKGNDGKGECDKCQPDSFACVGPSLLKCDAKGQNQLFFKDCGTAALCNAQTGVCGAQACQAIERRCDGDQPQVCDTSKNQFVDDGAKCTLGLCNPTSSVCFECKSGDVQCHAESGGSLLQKCENGLWATKATCPVNSCDAVQQKCTACNDGQMMCDGSKLVQCSNGFFDTANPVKTCQPGETCDAGLADCLQCQPGTWRCDGAGKLYQCLATGKEEQASDCGDPNLCDAAAQGCRVCAPGSYRCTGSALEACNATGTAYDLVDTCQSAALCDANQKACLAPACVAGDMKCVPGNQRSMCKADLTGYDTKPCGSAACVDGVGCMAPQKVVAGNNHACALLDGGYVLCWGNNGRGQCGVPASPTLQPTLVRTAGQDPKPINGVTSLSAGEGHTCVVMNDQPYCFGDNSHGQLGDGSLGGYNPSPVPAKGLQDLFLSVAAGGSTTCAVSKSGTLWCWGANGLGQVGVGSTSADIPVPTQVVSLGGVVAVSTSSTHACAVAPKSGVNELWCWGSNSFLQLGNPQASNPSLSPVKVLGFTASQVVASSNGANTLGNSCAHSGGSVFCWGRNADGELGRKSTGSPDANAAKVALLQQTKALASAYGTTCAIEATTGVNCWGACKASEICGGAPPPVHTPVPISNGDSWDIAVGQNVACTVGTGSAGMSEVRCWGSNNLRQLGSSGGSTAIPQPIVIP